MKTASESRSGKRIRIEEPSRARLVPRRPTSSIRPSTSERFTTQRAPRTATPTTIPTRKRLSRLGYREQPSDPFGDRVVAGEAYSSTRERVADGINGTRQRQQRSLPDPGSGGRFVDGRGPILHRLLQRQRDAEGEEENYEQRST